MAAGVCGTEPLVFRLQEGAPELVREVLLERGWEEFEEQRQGGVRGRSAMDK